MRRVRVPASASPSYQAFPQAPPSLNRAAADVPMSSSSSGAPLPGSDTATEIVTRPTGIRHGRWEAPAWAFWTFGAAVLVAALLYALARLGYFRRRAG